jgi:decaprenylphospho-beta-D-erythro-pentofuranosid-2-ulose 2-reductase
VRDALGTVDTVLVLGGASEIALATVDALLDEGGAHRVALAVRRPEDMADEVARLTAKGAAVEVFAFDADLSGERVAAVEAVFDHYGDIDVVLVAFGLLGAASVANDPEAAARLFETNTVGAAAVTLAAANRMVVQGHGALVVLSSVAGERVRRSNFVYGASKAGIDGFALGLADHLHGSGVDVVVVRPGFVHTRMTAGMKAPPLSTDAPTVARAIVTALRTRRAVVWVPSPLRWLMVVLRHLPRAVFRRLPL